MSKLIDVDRYLDQDPPVNHWQRWSKYDDLYIIKNYNDEPEHIAQVLGRSTLSIIRRRTQLGMTSHDFPRANHSECQKWTDDEDQFIRDHRDELTYQQIADYLGRTYTSTCAHIRVLRQKEKQKKWAERMRNYDYASSITTEAY